MVRGHYRGWEEPLASEPSGVYQHSDKRPLLGRKLSGKSHQEMLDLGLVVEPGSSGGEQSPPTWSNIPTNPM